MSPRPGPRKVAVVGGGWAGLAAAVQATRAGHRVTVFEMACQWGGRARSIQGGDGSGGALDNGQHILIGAYTATLSLMRSVGADPDALLWRQPLEICDANGHGLRLPRGPAVAAFVWAVARCSGWSWRDRLSLLRATAAWAAAGFRCDPLLTVDALCAGLTPAVRQLLIDPLCLSALNTAAQAASAQVLLRVLRDALFGGRGAADLLLPRQGLDALWPTPAAAWLEQAGARLRIGQRAQQLNPTGAQWQIDGEAFDAVVLACSASEAGRLSAQVAPDWSARSLALRYEPIVTVYLQACGVRLPAAMVALRDGDDAPAQFVFDHGAIGGRSGLLACVVSGAGGWVDAGLQETASAVLRQVLAAFPATTWRSPPRLLRVIAEKRATFRCSPGLARPTLQVVAPSLVAAGDYIAGPYPATLEGAMRSGIAAAAALD